MLTLVNAFISNSTTLYDESETTEPALKCLAALQDLMACVENIKNGKESDSGSMQDQPERTIDSGHANAMKQWFTAYSSGNTYLLDNTQHWKEDIIEYRFRCTTLWKSYVVLRTQWDRERPPNHDLIYHSVESIIRQVLECFRQLAYSDKYSQEMMQECSDKCKMTIADTQKMLDEYYSNTPSQKKEKMRELLKSIMDILDSL